MAERTTFGGQFDCGNIKLTASGRNRGNILVVDLRVKNCRQRKTSIVL